MFSHTHTATTAVHTSIPGRCWKGSLVAAGDDVGPLAPGLPSAAVSTPIASAVAEDAPPRTPSAAVEYTRPQGCGLAEAEDAALDSKMLIKPIPPLIALLAITVFARCSGVVAGSTAGARFPPSA